MNEDVNIRIEDYGKIEIAHDKIVNIINESNLTIFHAVGLLETIKQEIYMELDKEEVEEDN